MKVGKGLFEIYESPFKKANSLIVGWKTQDIGKLGTRVLNFLIEALDGRAIGELKPLGFFSFGGVRFKEDLVQITESKFWICEKGPLLLFKSDEPEFGHYKFLNGLLDFAKRHFQIKELYTIQGALSLSPHTQPRRILTVFNQLGLKQSLQGYELIDMTWQGPPAISSYLLWIARKKGISGVSLWPEIPFYLAPREDPQATKMILSFLNRKFHLGLTLEGFDLEIKDQNDKITRLRRENSETNQYFNLLESGERLGEEAQLKLAHEVYDLLRREE